MGLGKITIATATNKASLHTDWINVGTITGTGAIGADRLVATVEAKSASDIALLEPSEVPYAYLFRFRTDGDDNNTARVQLYIARRTDYYTGATDLTITRGTLLHSGSIYFADIITPSNENILLDPEEYNDAWAVPEFAQYYIRTMGWSKFLFLGIALNGNITTIYIDVAYLYE